MRETRSALLIQWCPVVLEACTGLCDPDQGEAICCKRSYGEMSRCSGRSVSRVTSRVPRCDAAVGDTAAGEEATWASDCGAIGK